MSRIRTGFVIGTAVFIVGLFLALNAENLATHWEMIGKDAWGGTTDPDKRHLYQMFGMLLASFGVFLTGATFYQWISRAQDVSPSSGPSSKGIPAP